ncbi:hypothetical protein ACIA5G_36050 [Amycolatopsis sp. NPDC051758]|uniref:DUF7660 family protein n=1 Tax=Amycolatopsis sp. NPDC051758 TaxID=3363935 RepID=UPI003788B2A1
MSEEMFKAGRDQLVTTIHTLLAEWQDGPPDWENDTLPRYLDALAAWLQGSEGYFANQGRPIPADGWEIIRVALEAATIYE